jgi:hypothetical protein
MKRLSEWFPLIIFGLSLVAFVLAGWYLGLFAWLRADNAKDLLDGIYKSLLIVAVVSGAALAYFRFFAYGFVFYLADSDVSVEVMSLSSKSNLHFIRLKAANRGTFRLRIEEVTWEVTDFPEALGLNYNRSGEPAGGDADGRILQVIDRGETISLLVACREVSANTVAGSAYHVTMKASGRTWYSSCAVSNRLSS